MKSLRSLYRDGRNSNIEPPVFRLPNWHIFWTTTLYYIRLQTYHTTKTNSWYYFYPSDPECVGTNRRRKTRGHLTHPSSVGVTVRGSDKSHSQSPTSDVLVQTWTYTNTVIVIYTDMCHRHRHPHPQPTTLLESYVTTIIESKQNKTTCRSVCWDLILRPKWLNPYRAPKSSTGVTERRKNLSWQVQGKKKEKFVLEQNSGSSPRHHIRVEWTWKRRDRVH